MNPHDLWQPDSHECTPEEEQIELEGFASESPRTARP